MIYLSFQKKKKKDKEIKKERFRDVTAQRLVIQWLALDSSILIKPQNSYVSGCYVMFEIIPPAGIAGAAGACWCWLITV